MSIRKPPSPFTPGPNTLTLKKGDQIERVHQTAFAGDSFNPGLGGQTRFAPINDASGSTIPTMYAGTTTDCAIYETIFHDVPVTPGMKTVRQKDVHIRSHTTLELQRDLKLAKLFGPDLRKWGIKPRNLVGTSAKLYGQTAQWAEAIHANAPDIDGLVWVSNQCDPDCAYLFFGDRVASKDFKILSSRDGATDKSFLADVRAAGRRGGIVLT